MGADARPARGPGGGRPPARQAPGVRESPPARARPRARPRAEPDAARPAPGPTGGALGVSAGPHLPHPALGGAPAGRGPHPARSAGLVNRPASIYPACTPGAQWVCADEIRLALPPSIFKSPACG